MNVQDSIARTTPVNAPVDFSAQITSTREPFDTITAIESLHACPDLENHTRQVKAID
ncbi:hypothetical protein ANO14919_075380 [Xylariales sp. No.14919]|nr:hypothetical protein ANO14919_075380 [Xylariales sp. No.14919]